MKEASLSTRRRESRAERINDMHLNERVSLNRESRIRDEILMIAEHFSIYEGVYCDEENFDWLIIPKYPLPAKWFARWAKILIIFPEGYPITPPIGFYLNRQFRLKTGETDPHLTGAAHDGAADLRAQGWQWYCVRLDTNS